jgi:hypothetical protein
MSATACERNVGCGRVDDHPPHDWRLRGRDFFCGGPPLLEGGHPAVMGGTNTRNPAHGGTGAQDSREQPHDGAPIPLRP